MLLCCITLSSSRENQRNAQEVARRIYGAVAGEVFAQVKTYQVPITNSYPSHYIICHLPLVFLSPTSPLPFYSPLFRSSFCLLVLPCAFYLLASSLAKNLLLWILIHLLIFLRDPIMMNQLLVSFVH